MKHLITALILLITAISTHAQQRYMIDNNGNYVVVKKTTASDTAKAIPSGKTFTDSKGTVWPVYLSVNGKPYIIRTSKKSGNVYKQYLKIAASN